MRSAALTFAMIVAFSLAGCRRPFSHSQAEVTAEDLQAARQANQTLENYKQELSQLQEPMR